MHRKYNNLFESTRQLDVLLEGKVAKIQKIMSSPSAICLFCRVPGETFYLYIGRGGRGSGVFYFDRPIPPEYRIKDKYLEFLRKELKNWALQSVKILESAPVVHLNFFKNRETKDFFLLFDGRDLHFIVHETSKGESLLFKSWSGKREKSKEVVEVPLLEKELKDRTTREDFKLDFKEEEMENVLWGKYLIDRRQKKIKRHKKFLQRKKSRITKDLEKNFKWRTLEEIVQGGQWPREVSAPFFLVGGVKIRVTGRESSGKIKDLIYTKLKKLKKGEFIQRERLIAVEKMIGEGSPGSDEVAEVTFKRFEGPVWRNQKVERPKDQGQQDKDVDYFSVEGHSVAIGKNIRGNDRLRNSWAKGSDTWLHIEGEKGSHLVVKTDNFLNLSKDSQEALASLLSSYSNYQGLEIPIIYSQVKGIKGLKGVAGSVTIKKPRYLTLSFRKDWQEILSIL